MKQFFKNVPTILDVARRAYWRIRQKQKNTAPFPGSHEYWEHRYARGGSSGAGSYGKFADFKAKIINAFVHENGVRSVIEYGCGDGNQLQLADYPKYVGFDVSPSAVAACKEIFKLDPTKSFKLIEEYVGETADLTLSLDVLYHLVEDDVFESYMTRLFSSSDCYVIVYSSDTDNNFGYQGTHVRHRKFTKWLDEHIPGWGLVRRIPNEYPYKGDPREGSFADFYIYRKI
jgi:SAM-dependent methyltransferase